MFIRCIGLFIFFLLTWFARFFFPLLDEFRPLKRSQEANNNDAAAAQCVLCVTQSLAQGNDYQAALMLDGAPLPLASAAAS